MNTGELAVDFMPNGNPGDNGYGVVWNDICSVDCITNNPSPLPCLHLSAHPSFMEVSSVAYNGGTAKPLYLGYGAGLGDTVSIAITPGNGFVGIGTANPATPVELFGSTAAANTFSLVDSNSGGNAYSQLELMQSATLNSGLKIQQFNNNYPGNGICLPSLANFDAAPDLTNGMDFMVEGTGVNSSFRWYVGGSTTNNLKMQMAQNGNVTFYTNVLSGGCITAAGTITAASFAGNGAGLTNLPASVLAGTLSDSQLSTNVARLNQANAFNNPGNNFVGSFTGSGAGLTNLPASSLIGTIASCQLSTNVALQNQANAFSNPSNTFVGSFSGNGAGLTNVPATVLGGTLVDNQLSTNVPLLNQANTFGNPGNTFVGSFGGNGAGLTNVPAMGLGGTLTDSQLSTNVALLNQANTFNNPGNTFVGAFTGDATGLTNLGAASLTGSVPLASLGNAITNWGSNIIVTNAGTGNSVVISGGQVLINGFPALTNNLHNTGTPTITTNVAKEYARIINSTGDQSMTIVIWFTNTPSSTAGTKLFTINFANPYVNPPTPNFTAGLSSDGTFDGSFRPTIFVWGVSTTNATVYLSSAASGVTPLAGKYYTNYLTFTGQ